jgi:hypothetical protein
MPLEGHWQRVHTPLRAGSRRERRALAALLTALAAAVAVLVIVLVAHGSAGTARGCVDVTVASTTGGARLHACGDRARSLCRGDGAGPGGVPAEVRAACARAGLG